MSDLSHTADTSIHVLLDHRKWVLRLARALSRDDASAADLAQDAWVRALERPPAHSGALRAWLGTVVRNLARDRARSAERRERRERVPRGSSSASDASVLVARAEAHARVVDAVVALQEPYRTTVLLHYFEGVALGEIAERMDVSRDAAKKRLQRAHAMLRRALDDAHDGDRRAWLVPLLAVGDWSAPSVARTRLRTAVTGVSVAVGLSVVATLSWRALDGREFGVDDGVASRASVATATDAATPVPHGSGGLQPDATAPRDDTRSASRGPGEAVGPGEVGRAEISYAFHIVDEAGSPLSGVSLSAFVEPERTAFDDIEAVLWASRVIPAPDAIASTDAGGFARIALPSSPQVSALVVVRRTGFAEARTRVGRSDAMRGAPVRVLTLGRAHVLRGRIVGAEGVGRSDLVVHASPVLGVGGLEEYVARRVVPTSSGGWFEIEDVAAGDWAVFVRGRDMLRSRVATVRVPDAEAVVIRLSRGTTISGSLTDAETGAPLAGVRVAIVAQTDEGWPMRVQVTTTADGSYRHVTMAPGRLDGLIATRDGYFRAEIVNLRKGRQKLPPGGSLVLDAALRRGGSARGRVTMDGRPASGVRVTATRPTRPWPPVTSATTGTDGRFDMRSLLDEALHFSARVPMPGTPDLVLAPTTGMDAVQMLAGAAVLEVNFVGTSVPVTTVAISGRVVDPDGVPIPDAAIGRYGVSSAADGSFTLMLSRSLPVSRGPLQIVISHGEFAYALLTVRDGAREREDVGEIVLQRPALVRGRIVDSRGMPIVGADVWFGEERGGSVGPVWISPASGMSGSTRTDALGDFELRLPWASGPYRFRSRTVGHATVESATIHHPGAPTIPVVDLVLQPAEVLRGRVVNARTGVPIRGARLGLVSLTRFSGANSAAAWVRQGSHPIVARTDAGGAFTIGDLDPGGYVVGALADGYASADASVSAPLDAPLVLRLEPLFEISGTVIAADGTPAVGVRIRAGNGGGREGERSNGVTNVNGEFRLRRLRSGKYSVVAVGTGGHVLGVLAGTRDVRIVIPVLANREQE